MTFAYLCAPDFADDVDRDRAALAEARHRIAQHQLAGDHVLLARLRLGDETAFAELFRTHTPNMHRVATALLGSGDGAADVVQNVMHRLWLQRSTVTVRGSMGAYLRAATINAARNAMRSEVRARFWAERAVAEQGGHTHSEADGQDHETRLVAVLERAIAQLPPRTKEIFLLWWGGELSYGEIAQAVGISVKGVERGRARALDTLRNVLIREGFGR